MQVHDDTRAQVQVLGLAVGLAILAVALAEVFDFPLFNDGADAEVTAQIVAQACIAQFGAGERWAKHAAVYECARGGALPNHVLTSPVARQ